MKEEPVVIYIGEVVISFEGGSKASHAGVSCNDPLSRYQRANDARDRTKVPLKLVEYLPMVESVMPSV
jgi:hypothetical protein